MKPLLWLRKSAGAILVLMCGIGIAYGMDHSRTPLLQIRTSPERDVVPSEVSLRVSTDSVPEVEMIPGIMMEMEGLTQKGHTSILRLFTSPHPAIFPHG